MTPDKLREKGNRWRELGQYDLANIYNQHAAALEEIERLKGELEESRRDLQFVERWANHHGVKPHITAKEVLSMIQHYPPIRAITEGYEDGKIPDTPNPWDRAEKAERRAERLKGHAEAMAPVGMLEPLRIIGDRLLAHYGDRFCLTRPTLHTDNERQVLVAALKALRAGLAYRADKGE